MLDMLAPRAEVRRIELEGVAAEDLAAGAVSHDRFVGVDLTEYEGGDDGRTARRIAPRAAAPGKSVVAKLARAFTALREELTRIRVDGAPPEIIARLHTNQPLHVAVARPLGRAQEALRHSSSRQLAEVLAGLLATDVTVVARLREATQLADEEFVEFLIAWDTASFGRPMLAEEEAALWRALQMFTSDADVRVGNLLSFIQEGAMSMRRSSIHRSNPLATITSRA